MSHTHTSQETSYLTNINISYNQLRKEMWDRLEPYWTKKYKDTVLTPENVFLTWDNNVHLTDKNGTGPRFIRYRFFNQNGKKKQNTIVSRWRLGKVKWYYLRHVLRMIAEADVLEG
jgi:hypothetical protein